MQPTSTTMTNDDAAGHRGPGNAATALRWPECAALPTAEIVDRLADNTHVLDAIGAEVRANEISDVSDRWNKAHAVLRAALASERKDTAFKAVQIEVARIVLDLAGHTAVVASAAFLNDR